MNLYFRLFALIFSIFFKPRRLTMMDTSVLTGRVWPTDLDNNLHMNNGRYLTLMDLGRFDLVVRAGFLPSILKNHWFPVLGASRISYFRPLKPFHTYALKTRLVAWDEKWLYLCQEFESGGKLSARAYVQGLFLAPEGKVPTADLFRVIDFQETAPPFHEDLAEWRRPAQGPSTSLPDRG
jgi:acyl-CoA thioesterase FadM